MMLLRLDGDGPKYAQITRALCGLIQSGVLPPGSRVPPTRELARDLGCSRNLVLLAYEQLILEGYLVSQGRGAGTFVSPDLPVSSCSPASASASSAAFASASSSPTFSAGPFLAAWDRVTLSRQAQRVTEVTARAVGALSERTRTVDVDFVYGLCQPDPPMIAAIRAALKATLREHPFEYAKPAGDDVLRQQLAARLRATRGIARPADQILVTSGAQQALEICTRMLVNEGDRVIVEDPTYQGINSILVAAGAEILRVPVDRQGIVVSELPEDGPPVRLVYVTPSHQFPTGAVLSASRRYALLAWARRRGACILEDDYDSEFRYDGRPIEALAAMHPGVIYCGTFAKTLFPAVRLGYLSLPRALMPAAVGCRWLSDLGSSAILQRLVGELMTRGAYDRHMRRMQRRYRARRDAMVTALRSHLGAEIEIEGEAAGAHFIVWLRGLPADRTDEFVATCRARGVGVYPARNALTVYSDRAAAAYLTRSAGLLVGYGLVDLDQIARGTRILAAVYRNMTRVPSFSSGLKNVRM
jgi:GntR family transcriptional regulator / MocR family aminotransferase